MNDELPSDATRVFAANELVKITIQAEDPERDKSWKRNVSSDAAYEGASYCGRAGDEDEAWTLLVPKADLRKWEQAAASNSIDIVVNRELLQGSFALPRMTE